MRKRRQICWRKRSWHSQEGRGGGGWGGITSEKWGGYWRPPESVWELWKLSFWEHSAVRVAGTRSQEEILRLKSSSWQVYSRPADSDGRSPEGRRNRAIQKRSLEGSCPVTLRNPKEMQSWGPCTSLWLLFWGERNKQYSVACLPISVDPWRWFRKESWLLHHILLVCLIHCSIS